MRRSDSFTDSHRPEALAGLPPELVSENLAWVRALALRIVGYEDLADDVAQEAWFRVASRPAPEGVPFENWIAGIVRMVVKESRRREASRKARERIAALEQEAGRSASERSRRLQHIELETGVLQEVMRLSEVTRRTVIQRYFNGFTVEEIAQEEGLSASSVRSRLARGCAELRERLTADSGSRAGAWFALAIPARLRDTALSATAAAPTATGGLGLLLTGGLVPAGVLVLALVSLAVGGWVLFGEDVDREVLPLTPPQALDVAAASQAPPDFESEPGNRPDQGASDRIVQNSASMPKATSVANANPPTVTTDLSVQVLDARGVPLANIPVALRESSGRTPKVSSWVVRTSATGKPTPLPAEDLKGLGFAAEAAEAFVHAPGFMRKAVPIAAADPITGILTLRINEPFGSLRIRAICDGGAELDQEVDLSIFSFGGSSSLSEFRLKIPAGATVDVPLAMEKSWTVVGVVGPEVTSEPIHIPRLIHPGERREVTVYFPSMHTWPSEEVDAPEPARSISGRVVDPSGQPVHGAAIWTFYSAEGSQQGARWSLSPPPSREFAKSNEDGLFTVKVSNDRGMPGLQAWVPRRTKRSLTVPVPEDGGPIVLVVKPTFRLHGRVIIPPSYGIQRPQISVTAMDDRTGISTQVGNLTPLEPDGSFTLRRIPGGSVDVCLHHSYKQKPLAILEGVSVGGEVNDVYLNDWDLAGLIFPVQFEVRLPQGLPGFDVGLAGAFPFGSVFIDGASSDLTGSSFRGVAASPEDSLVVSAQGCRRFISTVGRVGGLVELEPLLEVELQLDLGPELAAWFESTPSVQFRRLEYEPNDPFRSTSRVSPLLPGGSAYLQVSESGPMRVAFWKGGRFPSRIPTEDLPPALRDLRVDVDPSKARQVIALAVGAQ